MDMHLPLCECFGRVIKICNNLEYFIFIMAQFDYNGVVMKNRFLIVNLSHLHLRSLRDIDSNYISIRWEGVFYFSNAYSSSEAVQYSITLNHNIVLPLTQQSKFSLCIQNWENHMVIFEQDVDLSELKSRHATRKKVELRQGEILDFTVHLLKQNEFHLSSGFIQNGLQHFLFLHDMKLHYEDKNAIQGPSYFVVLHDAGSMIIPVANAVALISLPSQVKFQHFKNGKLAASSKRYRCEELGDLQMIRMVAGEDLGYDLEVHLLWGINLWHNYSQRSMLLNAQQIFIYEIEARLQAWKDPPAGLKLKLNYGNKTFELNGESDTSSIFRFARIIYFVMKSEEEDFEFVIEKNSKPIARAIIGSEEVLSYHLNTLKRKMMDLTGTRQLASIRFKCQKAKNLSLPQNNQLWKNQSLKGKNPAILLQFSQLSVQWQRNESCGLIIKTEEEQLFVPELTNFSYFQLEIEIPEPVVLTLRQEGNIYLKLVYSNSKDDFLGIAILNFRELRLGTNVLTLPFFKQQTAACLLHLVVNKVVPWPFVRGINAVESITANPAMRMVTVSIQFKQLQLTGYYYTFQYDRKSQLYCIVQVNRIKKVLILQMAKPLLFINSAGSDLLKFQVSQAESVKIRLTVLAGDGGFEEEVVGFLQKKVKMEQLIGGTVKFEQQQVSNDHGIAVGQMDFQIQQSPVGELKKLVKRDVKNADKVNRSIQKGDKSIENKQIPLRQRYASLKLPQIKDPRQERLKKLAMMLQLKQQSVQRRKQVKGKRVESERRAEITQELQYRQNYTSIDISPEEIRESQQRTNSRLPPQVNEGENQEFKEENMEPIEENLQPVSLQIELKDQITQEKRQRGRVKRDYNIEDLQLNQFTEPIRQQE